MWSLSDLDSSKAWWRPRQYDWGPREGTGVILVLNVLTAPLSGKGGDVTRASGGAFRKPPQARVARSALLRGAFALSLAEVVVSPVSLIDCRPAFAKGVKWEPFWTGATVG